MSKKINLLIIAFISVAMMSCNQDYTKALNLEGEWNLTEYKNGSTTTTYPIAIIGTTVKYTFSDIKEDGGNVKSESTTAGITTTLDESLFLISDKGTKITIDNNTFDFQVSNKELIISDGDQKATLEKL